MEYIPFASWNADIHQMADIFFNIFCRQARGIYDFDLTTGEIYPIMIQTSDFINNIQVVNFK